MACSSQAMIEAVLYEDGNGELIGFKVKGHAGYAKRGEDIVCAGVSALVLTTIQSLDRFLSCQPLLELPEGTDGGSGEGFYVRVELPGSLTEEDRKAARIILGTLEIGLEMTASEYGRYIRVRRCRYDDSRQAEI
ncbi:MAG: ribosomal-processing cysteine protease Prp [Thermacetogeniaceae bacterium]